VRHWPPSTKHRKGVMNIGNAKEDPLASRLPRPLPDIPLPAFPSYRRMAASSELPHHVTDDRHAGPAAGRASAKAASARSGSFGLSLVVRCVVSPRSHGSVRCAVRPRWTRPIKQRKEQDT